MDYKCLQTLLIHSLNSFRLRESYKLKRSYLLRVHDFVLNGEGMRRVMEKSKIFKFSKNASYFINFFFHFLSFLSTEAAPEAVKRKAEEVVEADESATDETAAVPEKKTKVDETTNGAEAEVVA